MIYVDYKEKPFLGEFHVCMRRVPIMLSECSVNIIHIKLLVLFRYTVSFLSCQFSHRSWARAVEICGCGLSVCRCSSVSFCFMNFIAKLLQSCPILCDPIDGSPPGFPVPGILQARTLEWVAISFSNIYATICEIATWKQLNSTGNLAQCSVMT